MTVKKFYLGSLGPFLYDDTDDIDDPDGDFSGETQKGFITDGSIQTTYDPIADNDVLRLKDQNTATALTSADDLDDIEDGWYHWSISSPTNSPHNRCILVQQTNGLQKVQMAFGGLTYSLLYIRIDANDIFYAWTKFWSKDNDGTGSELDADLLDGEEGTYYGKASDVSTNASDIDDLETWQATGVSGSFTTTDGKTVTVTNGLITGIV